MTKAPALRHFVLSGFSQQRGIRRFAFEAIAKDHSRSKVSVSADLSLIRGYGIHLQDLPLLCLELLESFPDSETGSQFDFSEGEMRRQKDVRIAALAASAQKRKFSRRAPEEDRDMAWSAAPGMGPEASSDMP